MNESTEVSPCDDRRRKPYLPVLLVISLLAGGIVFGTFAKLGTVDGLRAATSLVMPLSLIWLLLLATSVWWFCRRRLTLGLIYLLIWICMTLVFNERVSEWAIGALEWPSADAMSEAGNHQRKAIVVLGGGVYMTADGIPEMNRDGQRVYYAAQLWHAGRAESIVCTGEKAGIGDDQSEIARQLLVSVGVPNEVIFQIGGENTTQEMQNLKRFLDEPPAGVPLEGDVGLITSAFHMARAIRLASDNGLDLTPLPCSFRRSQATEFAPDQMLPSLDAGVTMRIAIKERMAALLGR